MVLVALFLGAYLLGAIPFGVLIARAKGVDIRSVGSGNIGATNVIRALGTGPGVLVFVLDVLKGLVPALVARWIAPERQDIWFYAGMAAVVGHSLSPFLRFKGGKGIATALGGVLGSAPLTALSCFAVFTVLLVTPRYMSLASLIAVGTGTFWGYVYKDALAVRVGYVLLELFVIYRHLPNIRRLLNGTEPKFSFKKSISTSAKPVPDATPEASTENTEGEGQPPPSGVAG
jgi:acyl phosphate:glycerol-3-phosphate acyltransferase